MVEQAVQAWTGARDGRRSARRLSHLGAHAWLARREREQASLDAEAASCLDRWLEAVGGPRSILVTADADVAHPSTDAMDTLPVTPTSDMAKVRQARRRRAREAAHRAAEERRAGRAAAATAELDSLIERTAAELQLLQARHTFLFATYTRAFVRAYSRATTVHAG